MMRIIKITVPLLIVVSGSCKKQFDHPPSEVIDPGEKINVSQIRARVPASSTIHRFSGDTSLYCTVIADESSGSFYATIFVRDDDQQAIQVNLLERGGIYAGDRIAIRLDGVSVRNASGCFMLDSISRSEHVVKISSGNKVRPKTTTITQVMDGLNSGPDMQSDLITLSGMEFIFAHRSVPFADHISRTRKDHILTSCTGNTIALSVSGFADFAAKPTPQGNGSISAILIRYDQTYRLELRSNADLTMNDPACTFSTAASGTFQLSATTKFVEEPFDEVNDQSEFNQEGWINFAESGAVRWKGNLKGDNYRALRMTAYGSAEKTVTWLITPPIEYSATKKISFKTGVEYFKKGHIEPVMAFVTTDFDGKNLSSANWTALREADYANMSDGNYNGPGGLRSSGEIMLGSIPLLAAGNSTFCLAFRYTGEPGFDTNVYLDDVVVK